MTGWAAALVAASLLGTLPAKTQDNPSPSGPVALETETVTKLLKKNDPPDYPPLAKLNFIQGTVRLRVYVGRDGRVSEAHVIAGHPFLAASALHAVRKWVYRPYRVGKAAVEFSTLVNIHFTLHSKTLVAFPPTAEKDLLARVTPPQVVKQPAGPSSDDHVKLRVLVDSEGRPLDAQLVSGSASEVREAEAEVATWTFRPARWGALAVPWYLDVDVPVRHWPA